MTLSDPLRPIHEENEASFLSYGPTPSEEAVQIVDTFGQYEAEYAAIRKGVGLISLPQRGLVEVTGKDRLDFLHRMLTNDLASLQPGHGRRAFLLQKTGRIAADVVVLHDSDRTLLEVDLFQAPMLTESLTHHVFIEDVQIRDASDQFLQLALKGPLAQDLLSAAGTALSTPLEFLQHQQVTNWEKPCWVFRIDEVGTLGLHLIVPRKAAIEIYRTLQQSFEKPAFQGRAKPIGWLAYNTARIEAGTPHYHIDFGPDSLPHETAILDQAVHFSKGCYPGQEIVARMQNLGHPKRVLVGLVFADDRLPIAGAQILMPVAPNASEKSDSDQPLRTSTPTTGEVIGAITSSCVSPMLGGKSIALAMVRWDMHEPGTTVAVPAEGQVVDAKVGPLASLRDQLAVK